MASLEKQIDPFFDHIDYHQKLGDHEASREKEEEPNLEKCNSSNQSCQRLFEVQAKVDIKAHRGVVDVVKLNNQLQQLEIYFNVHSVQEEQKIAFARLKLEGHAQTWWESSVETLILEGDPLVTKQEVF